MAEYYMLNAINVNYLFWKKTDNYQVIEVGSDCITFYQTDLLPSHCGCGIAPVQITQELWYNVKTIVDTYLSTFNAKGGEVSPSSSPTAWKAYQILLVSLNSILQFEEKKETF